MTRRHALALAALAAATGACAAGNTPAPRALRPAHHSPATPAPRPESRDVPDMTGQDLQLAQDTMQAAGFYALTSHDASGAGRMQLIDRHWKVCAQTPAGGTSAPVTTTIDFAAVKDDETCP